MNSMIHFLINSNVPKAVSYYESNYGSLENTVRLTGYPHKVQAVILAEVCHRAIEEDTPMQVVHHCLDNTMQGVILPERSAGVYCFDVYDPQERNILAAFDPEQIGAIHETMALARKTFIQARSVHDEQEKIYIQNMDFDKINRLTEETIQMLLDGKRMDCPGTEIHRFFGAASISGTVCYIPELTKDIRHRYFVKGRPGTGKSTFLKKIAEAARQRGFTVEIYHCSLDPNSLDMIVVRELGMCVFDSTAPHEFFPSRPEDEIIDIYQICVTPGTDEKYKAELDKLQSGYKELVADGITYLNQVKDLSEQFDAKLPQLSEIELTNTIDSILQQLF